MSVNGLYITRIDADKAGNQKFIEWKYGKNP